MGWGSCAQGIKLSVNLIDLNSNLYVLFLCGGLVPAAGSLKFNYTHIRAATEALASQEMVLIVGGWVFVFLYTC